MEASSALKKIYIACVCVTICAIFLYRSEKNRMNSTDIDDGSNTLDYLYPALVQCFTIIICGYTTGRLNLITRTEAKGLNTFVSTFSLPCVIFLSLARLDLSAVNWMFLVSIFAAKSIVFFSVILITFFITRPSHWGKRGLYAIFCTQSNDFAIGYPILVALYQTSHPDYPSYLYLMAPISLAILNPIAFVLMEIEKQRSIPQSPNEENVDENRRNSTNPQLIINETGDERCSVECTKLQAKLFGKVLKNIVTNPIVFMTVLGIFGNFIYNRIGFITGILEVFGSTFSGTALFVLGLRMVGSVQKLKGDDLIVSGVLIAVKLLVLPLVNREVVSILHPGSNTTESLSLSTFGFLYGTFPTAPAVFVFSTQYNLEVDMISSAMVACTFISAPLMYVSAKMTSLTDADPQHHFRELLTFRYDLAIVGLVVGLWVMVVFIVSRKMRQVPHIVTGFLSISQIIICVGVLLQNLASVDKGYLAYFTFSVTQFGIHSSRVWTALLAVILVMIQSRGLCLVLKLIPYFVIIGWGLPILTVAITGLSAKSMSLENPLFIYGNIQAAITLVVLLLCLLVTSVCLVLQQRSSRRQAKYLSLIKEVNSQDMADNLSEEGNGKRVLDIEDIGSGSGVCEGTDGRCASGFRCSVAEREVCEATLRNYKKSVAEAAEIESEADDPQFVSHTVLLLLLSTSMFIVCRRSSRNF